MSADGCSGSQERTLFGTAVAITGDGNRIFATHTSNDVEGEVVVLDAPGLVPRPSPPPPLAPVPPPPPPPLEESPDLEPPPSPETIVPCAVSGPKKKRQRNRQKPAGKCVFAGRGLCLATPKNGGKCTDLPRKKPCVRTVGCTWSGGKKSGACRAR